VRQGCLRPTRIQETDTSVFVTEIMGSRVHDSPLEGVEMEEALSAMNFQQVMHLGHGEVLSGAILVQHRT